VTATPLRAARASAVVAHTIFDRDVSTPRIANSAFRDVASRLVAAQENERIRIGRELHDDLGQQAALLAVKLDELSGNPRISAAKLRAGVADAERLLHELAISIHELSHQLHPAKLRLLGLVATIEALCRDSGARVSFSATNVPADVPEQTALCVFRVTQEALQNAVRHSGAQDIHVQLGFSGTHLTLRVTDTGSGFNPAASDRVGIGLVTMHERVELSGGSLKIVAARSTGTTVEATIPLSCIDANVPA
jgi:signal transduction histidine kinase